MTDREQRILEDIKKLQFGKIVIHIEDNKIVRWEINTIKK